MYDLARGGYTTAEINDMLRSNRTVGYRFDLLNKDEVGIGRINAEGSIDFNADVDIKRTCSLNISELKDIDILNDRVRPYMLLDTPTGVLEFPLGVFLLASPTKIAKKGLLRQSVDGYDKTIILADDKFTTRYTIPSGTNYVVAIKQILATAGIPDAEITATTKTTQTAIDFEIGTSKLAAVNKLLHDINYNDIYVDAEGVFRAEIYQAPEERTIDAYYMCNKKSIICDGAELIQDMFAAPNKFVRYIENAERGTLISTATNDDPTSPLSTVSRGRTVVDIEAVNDVPDQATLDLYVYRLLAESKVYEQMSFSTANIPNHNYLDCLYVENTELITAGKYIEHAWKMDLSVGGQMSHIVRRAT